MDKDDPVEPIAVVGLGYVGLPIALAFGALRPTIGFDINEGRVSELQEFHDRTREVTREELERCRHLSFTTDDTDLAQAGIFIVSVPTPIDAAKRPDFGPLLRASHTVGARMQPGSLVIFESTVYPGATEEICVPALEKASGLTYNTDFFVGYSPERINPGDPDHGLAQVVKVTSGSTPEVARRVDDLYKEIVPAGTHLASSIRVAEAAKVIENVQRDVNIALVNELAVLFERLGIDTHEVLEAANTKWNFLPFKPGLVGGHCIGVDPYYLTHAAQMVGHHPELILAGRRQNDIMGHYVADQVLRLVLSQQQEVSGARILVLGLTFKENCADTRNSQVRGVVERLRSYGFELDLCDPWVDLRTIEREFGQTPISLDRLQPGTYGAIVVAVAHKQFLDASKELSSYLRPTGGIFDVKGVLGSNIATARL